VVDPAVFHEAHLGLAQAPHSHLDQRAHLGNPPGHGSVAPPGTHVLVPEVCVGVQIQHRQSFIGVWVRVPACQGLHVAQGQ
jgi:hypothetical protein